MSPIKKQIKKIISQIYYLSRINYFDIFSQYVKIQGFFKKAQKAENIEKGKDLIEKEIKRIGFSHTELFKQEFLDSVFEKYKYKDLDEMYAAVGFGCKSLLLCVFPCCSGLVYSSWAGQQETLWNVESVWTALH